MTSFLDVLDIDPHPELVAIQRPTPAEVTLAAAVLGWQSPGYLIPDCGGGDRGEDLRGVPSAGEPWRAGS